MSAFIAVTCNCSPDCPETTIADHAYTVTDARIVAHGRGWDCDTIGGTTVDVAPGHTPQEVSAAALVDPLVCLARRESSEDGAPACGAWLSEHCVECDLCPGLHADDCTASRTATTTRED